MMKPDIDTEKYSSHNIHNNIKKNSVSSVTSVAKFISWQPLMMPRPHPETKENQHKRFAQHIGPPCHGVSLQAGMP
jgi:hypothetical protein